MIGAVERDEAFGVLGGHEDLGGVLDPDHTVGGRMHHHQRLFHACNGRCQGAGGNIVDEGLPDGEGPPAQFDLCCAIGVDRIKRAGEIVRHMARIVRRAQGHNRFHAGDLGGGLQHRRAAQRMADHQRRGQLALGKVGRRLHQIVDVGTERGVGELAIRMAKPGEIEAQHRDPHGREAPRDPPRGWNVL